MKLTDLRNGIADDRERNIKVVTKTVKVAAAIIRQGDKIFATQRGYGEFAGLWEFPGGKLEPGESPEAALVREIKEELDSDITVGPLFYVLEHDYPDFHLSMNCYFCELINGNLTLIEHTDARWLTKDNLFSVPWIPADLGIIEKLEQSLGGSEVQAD